VPRIPTKIQSAARPGPGGALPATRTPGPYQSRERFSVRALNRTQTAAQQATAKAANRFDADNNVIAGVFFGATIITPVQHGLGRAFVGAHLVNPSGGYLAYQVLRNVDPRLDAYQLRIICQHDVTADVVVY
jgi:hypothetical protein